MQTLGYGATIRETKKYNGNWKIYNSQHIVWSAAGSPPKFFRIGTDGNLISAGELVNGVTKPPVYPETYIKQ